MRKTKILILSFLVLLVFFPFFSVKAASWKFMWENTTVKIPLGESIEKYKNIPKAKLYKDGNLLTDTEVTYNTEGDWLYYFKDINPYKVGEYYVWYKAYESNYSPGTCTGYKALINFIIEDKEKPKINILNPVYKIKKDEAYDLSLNYVVLDNDEIKEIKTVGFVDNTIIGDYNVKVIAIDNSNNQEIKEFTVNVYEDSYPVISTTIVGDLELIVGEEFDIKGAFFAKDNIDGDLTDSIIFPPFNTSEAKEYTYTVSVKNSLGLLTEYSILVKILNDDIPEIILSTHNIILDYKTNIEEIDFKKYVKDIKDNEEINYNNLTIRHDIENKVGSYTIWYTYKDLNNSVTESISCTMASYDKPEIYVDDIVIYTNSNINYSDYIRVTDASDPNILSSLEIYDSEVNYQKEGTYYAEAFCMNSSGKSEIKRFKVLVKEKSKLELSPVVLIILFISIFIGTSLLAFIIFYFVNKKRKEKLE